MTEFLELYMRLLENMTSTSRRTSAKVDNFPDRMRDLILATSNGFLTILRVRIIYGERVSVRACVRACELFDVKRMSACYARHA